LALDNFAVVFDFTEAIASKRSDQHILDLINLSVDVVDVPVDHLVGGYRTRHDRVKVRGTIPRELKLAVGASSLSVTGH
jgi:hypothetical protein